MKITNAIYRINTVAMRDVKENITEIMGKLNPYFSNTRINNLPKEAPNNIPRLIANDKAGLFNITVTNESVLFELIKGEEANDEVIFESMAEIVDKVGSFFEDYSDAPFDFAGYSITCKLPQTDIEENPIDFVSKKISGMDSDLPLDNSMMRKCFIQGDYYINITMRNDKKMKVFPKAPGSKKPDRVEIEDEFLVVEVDVNDKYAFIYKPNYECEIEQAITLCEDVHNFYNDKLLDFVKTGDFGYFK